MKSIKTVLGKGRGMKCKRILIKASSGVSEDRPEDRLVSQKVWEKTRVSIWNPFFSKVKRPFKILWRRRERK
jgi:hypothetical protein